MCVIHARPNIDDWGGFIYAKHIRLMGTDPISALSPYAESTDKSPLFHFSISKYDETIGVALLCTIPNSFARDEIKVRFSVT